MKVLAFILAILLTGDISEGMINAATSELIIGKENSFTVIVGCKDCEVEILKELEVKYKVTKTLSSKSEKFSESETNSLENSFTDTNIKKNSLESTDAKEEGIKGKDKVKVNQKSSGNVKGEEFTKGVSLKNSTIFSRIQESPEEGKEVIEESFYGEIPFVVLGPTLKIGSATYRIYVPPETKEGAYWIPIRVDNSIHYIGVLLKDPWKPPPEVKKKEEVKKVEIWEEEPFLVYFAIIFFAMLILVLSYFLGKFFGKREKKRE